MENDRYSFLSLFVHCKLQMFKHWKNVKMHICADGENMLKYKNAGDNILSTREKRYNQKERDLWVRLVKWQDRAGLKALSGMGYIGWWEDIENESSSTGKCKQ